MTLRQGWNQIGNPYNFQIDWNEVLNQNGIESEVGGLKVFEGDGYVDQTVLKPFEGAFVFSESSAVLNIPLVAEGSTSRVRESFSANLNWFVDLHLEMADKHSNFLKIGMLASDGNAYKSAIPPKFIEYVELASIHENDFWKSYDTDFSNFKNEHSWSITINQNVSQLENSVLKWGKINSLSKGQLMLVDEAAQVVIDMVLNNQYVFNTSTQRNFKILYHSNGVRGIDIPNVQVGKVYPNPVISTASIPVILPSSENKYQIEMLIFDIKGRQMGSAANFNLDAGIHQLEIGSNAMPSGLYLYRLNVLGKKQEMFNGKFTKH